MHLDETLHLRISRELLEAIEAHAQQLHVRPADVIRMALAEKLAEKATHFQDVQARTNDVPECSGQLHTMKGGPA